MNGFRQSMSQHWYSLSLLVVDVSFSDIGDAVQVVQYLQKIFYERSNNSDYNTVMFGTKYIWLGIFHLQNGQWLSSSLQLFKVRKQRYTMRYTCKDFESSTAKSFLSCAYLVRGFMEVYGSIYGSLSEAGEFIVHSLSKLIYMYL